MCATRHKIEIPGEIKYIKNVTMYTTSKISMLCDAAIMPCLINHLVLSMYDDQMKFLVIRRYYYFYRYSDKWNLIWYLILYTCKLKPKVQWNRHHERNSLRLSLHHGIGLGRIIRLKICFRCCMKFILFIVS